MPCIYGIINEVNEKIYVGKATDVENRFMRHKSMLKCNRHFNIHLQRSYNKHGKDNFKYIILEECELDVLSSKEQHWIDFNQGNLYNSIIYVEDQEGYHNSFHGKKHSDKTKELMSSKKKGIYDGESNPNFGKRWDENQKNKMRGSNNVNSKLCEEDVIEIKKTIGSWA
jgi:group I intron endonuclease